MALTWWLIGFMALCILLLVVIYAWQQSSKSIAQKAADDAVFRKMDAAVDSLAAKLLDLDASADEGSLQSDHKEIIDPQEQIPRHPSVSGELELRLQFDYSDSEGRATRRTVDMKRFCVFGTECEVIGHCLLRGADRTFLMSRMSNIRDADGRPIDNLSQHLISAWEGTPDWTRRRLYSELDDSLQVLFYLARLDGAMRAKEASAITAFVVSCGHPPEFAAEVPDVLRTYSTPTPRTFSLALGRLSRTATPLLKQQTIDAARAIIASKSQPKASEMEALAKVETKLG